MFNLPTALLLAVVAFTAPSSGSFANVPCSNRIDNADGSSGKCMTWIDAADGNATSNGNDKAEIHQYRPGPQITAREVTQLCKSAVNGPQSRACWTKGFDINTDFDNDWPDTNITRKYHFEITNGTAAPDGTPRPTLLINNQYMGPTIFADWGDIVEVTVVNKLQNNGTGIHWHGIRQWNNCWADGVPGMTECPIAPGHSKVYRWQATQYGTAWYHSHVVSRNATLTSRTTEELCTRASARFTRRRSQSSDRPLSSHTMLTHRRVCSMATALWV